LVDGTAIPRAVTAKALGLLAYLILNPRPHGREALSGLFWPEMGATEAQANLRRVLANLKPYTDAHVSATRAEIGMIPSARIESDCARLEAALSSADIASLAEAANAYQGEFLEGLSLKDAPEFEEWVVGQRARYHDAVVQALLALVAAHQGRGDLAQALDAVNRLLRLDPWREEAHRAKMRLLCRMGQRSAALAQFEACKTVLRRELGVPPAGDTVALYERIQLAARPSPPLPTAAGEFVGRAAPVATLREWLTGSDARVITLHAPGGMGKTRCALAIAGALREWFMHGVAWVDLVSATGASDVPRLIAEALGLSGSKNPGEAVTHYLREREVLLVLDNFEHVLDAAPFVSALARAAPELKILITSQTRLNLEVERVFELEGLALPAPGLETSGLDDHEATRLFGATARGALGVFAPSPEERAAIASLCRMVQGVPLAIELAAGMTQTQTCVSILETLSADLPSAHSAYRDTAPRHASLRAVFDASWSRLDAAQQTALARLTVFEDSFDTRAALEVTGVSRGLLGALLARAVLGQVSGARWRIHEVLRVFARERLQKDEQRTLELRDAHAAHFAAFVNARFADMGGGPRQSGAYAEVALDWQNVALALRRTAERAQWPLVVMISPGIFRWISLRSMFVEGLALFQSAAEVCAGHADMGDEARRARAMLDLYQAGILNQLGDPSRAIPILERSASVFEGLSNSEDLLDHAKVLLGNAYWVSGQPANAVALYRDALRTPDSALRIKALGNLGVCLMRLGDLNAARAAQTASLELSRATQSEADIPASMLNLAMVAYYSGDSVEAGRLLLEAAPLFERTNDRYGAALCLGNLASLESEHGRHAESAALCRRALGIYREIGNRFMTAKTTATLAEAVLAGGDPAEAERLLREALKLCATESWLETESYCRRALSDVLRARGRTDDGLAEARRSLALAQRSANAQNLQSSLASIALLYAARGQLTRARPLAACLLAQPNEPEHGTFDPLRAVLSPDAPPAGGDPNALAGFVAEEQALEVRPSAPAS